MAFDFEHLQLSGSYAESLPLAKCASQMPSPRGRLTPRPLVTNHYEAPKVHDKNVVHVPVTAANITGTTNSNRNH